MKNRYSSLVYVRINWKDQYKVHFLASLKVEQLRAAVQRNYVSRNMPDGKNLRISELLLYLSCCALVRSQFPGRHNCVRQLAMIRCRNQDTRIFLHVEFRMGIAG